MKKRLRTIIVAENP